MPRDAAGRNITPRRRRKQEEAAKPLVIDFTKARDPRGSAREHVMSPKQIRARARRRKAMTKEEYEILYKPVEEWDEEELARGRPRNKSGDFRGRKPAWLSAEIHEAAMERFKLIIRNEVNVQAGVAMGVIRNIMGDDELDDKGKWRTPPSVKLQAATLMLEHTIGKPRVVVEQDISIKLQALLATATVGPGADIDEAELERIAMGQYEEAFGEKPRALPTGEILDAEVIEDDDD